MNINDAYDNEISIRNKRDSNICPSEDNTISSTTYSKIRNFNFNFSKNKLSNGYILNNQNLPPANPLIKRTKILENGQRVGNLEKIIKLPEFNKNQELIKLEFKSQQPPKFYSANISPIITSNEIWQNHQKISDEKLIELSAYINSFSMKNKLVYLKNKLTKENLIELNKIININKLSDMDYTEICDELEPYYKLKDDKDKTLIFESRFESGNLLCAFKMEENEKLDLTKYLLVLENDTNTTGYIQWFFFKVSNIKKGRKVNFTIINMRRKRSLYSNNLKIVVYSTKRAEKENIGFYRGGDNINYYRNNHFFYINDRRKNLYSLTFDYEFQYDNDIVYFSNCIPYLYSDLTKQLNYYQLNDDKFPFFHRRTLCSTLGGNDCDMITINSKISTSTHTPLRGQTNLIHDNRKAIILVARAHPGETVGSYVMKGALDFLMGNSDEAIKLRELYVFKIIPILNPDGVLAGNSRTSFAGCDLNRRWIEPDEILHPEVYHTKNMILTTAQQREIGCICDFHGHIGALNSFFYCNHKENKRACSLFPYICTKISNIINYAQSNFLMPKFKYSTCRISLFKELNLNNIVTLETSFFGTNRYSDKNLPRVYYTTDIIESIGRDICLGILSYYYKYENKVIEKRLLNKNKLLNVDLKEFENMMLKEEKSEENDKENNIEDSESEPSVDNLEVDTLLNLMPTMGKKQKNRVKFIRKKYTSNIKIKENKNEDDNLLFENNNNKNEMRKTFSKSKIIFKNNQNIQNNNIINNDIPKIESGSLYVKITKYKDSYTQTEEIFFKMHWSFFAGEYLILQSKIYTKKNDFYSNRFRNSSYDDFFNSKNILVKNKISNNTNNNMKSLNYNNSVNKNIPLSLLSKKYNYMNMSNNNNNKSNLIMNSFNHSNKNNIMVNNIYGLSSRTKNNFFYDNNLTTKNKINNFLNKQFGLNKDNSNDHIKNKPKYNNEYLYNKSKPLRKIGYFNK